MERSVFMSPGPYSGNIANESICDIYTRFFKAVLRFQEPNGRGSVMIRKNDDDKTMHFDAHYCNYENMDCTRRIAEYLRFPGFFMPGIDPESLDSFHCTIEKIEYSNHDFGLSNIITSMKNVLPNAMITDQFVKNDFCSLQFQT